jgi:hypothetical protein
MVRFLFNGYAWFCRKTVGVGHPRQSPQGGVCFA